MRIKFDLFRTRVMARFKALEDYIGFVEVHIQESHDAAVSQVLTENRTPPDSSDESEREWFCVRQHEIDECNQRYAIDFPRILRFTVLMSIFTLVESNLSLLAQEIMKRKDFALDMEDQQVKNPVKRFKKFWTKVARLPSWWSDPRWGELLDIEELRNCIAHRNGVVEKRDGRITQLLPRGCGVRLVALNDPLADPDEVGTLEIEERYYREAVKQMTALFDEIFNRAGCFGSDHVVVEPE